MVRYLLAALAAASFLMPVHAAVSVSDVFASGVAPTYKLHYLLNEDASSGTLTVAAMATPNTAIFTQTLSGAQLTKGPHDFSYTPSPAPPPGQYVFNVNVSAAAHAAYDPITPVTTIATGATISYAARFNKRAGTLTYGHVVMADFTLNKAYEFNSAGQLIQSISAPTTDATGFVPVGANWDDNGILYTSSQNIDYIYRYTPTGSPASPTYPAEPDATYTGPFSDPTTTPPDGSMFTRAFQLFGSGDSATVYMASYTDQAVHKTTLNDLVDTPPQLFSTATAASLAPTRLDMLLVTPDQKTIYVGDGESPGTLRHVNKWVLAPDSTWILDPTFAENDATLAKLVGRARGLAFTPDEAFLYVTQNGGASSTSDTNFIAKVSLARGSGGSAATAVKALQIAGGLLDSTVDDLTALDKNGDGAITLADAILFASLSGGITLKIPTLSGAALPVTCDTDAKGNLLVVAKADGTGTGTSGDVFFILAPPDSGSHDSYMSPAFPIV